MNDSNFDQHFRDRLSNHTTPVDTEAIWNGIQVGSPAHATEKSPVWKWFWPVLLLLLLVGLGTGWWLMHPVPSKVQKVAVFDESTTVASGESSSGKAQYPHNEAVDTGSESVGNVNGDISAEMLNNAAVANVEESKDNSPKTASSHRIDWPEEKSLGTAQLVAEKSATKNPVEIQVVSKEEESTAPSFSVIEKMEDQRTQRPNEGTKVAEVPGLDNSQNDLEDMSEIQMPLTTKEAIDNIIVGSGQEIDHVDENSAKTTSETQNDSLSATNVEMTAVVNEIEPTDKSELARSFFVRADLGGGLINKKLQSLHSDWDLHTTNRSNTEKPLEHMGGQLLFGYRLPIGVYAATGISFTQITERFHVNRDYSETEILENQVAEIHVGIDGDTTFVLTTAQVEHHFHQEVLNYNRYTMIDLPLILGYEWNRSKWHLAIEGGVQFNLSLRTHGHMVAPTDEIVELEASGMFRANLSVNYLANFRVGYALSPRCQLFLSPGIRIVSASMLQHDVQRQSYNLYGLQIGTRFWLK